MQVYKYRIVICVFLGFVLLMWLPPSLEGGILASVGTRWQSAALRPLEEEATPNYYGYGLGCQLGYSFGQIFDTKLYGNYVPSRLKSASLGKENLQFWEYGLELGFRIAGTIYLGFRGGYFSYRMLFRTDHSKEVDGEWKGPGGGVSLGAFRVNKKSHMFQITVDIASAALKRRDQHSEVDRKLDTFGVSVAYVFNQWGGFRLTSLFGSGFLRSLDF